jgi:hypothetical protein
MQALITRRNTALAGLTLLALTVGVLLVAPHIRSSQHHHHEKKVVVLTGAYAFHFDTLADMVATSASVVEGTVVDAARGRVIDEHEVTYTRRLLTIQVDRTLAGRPAANRVTVETAGWRQVVGHPETELRIEDEVHVTVGANGIFFLYDFEHNGHFGFVNDQGLLLTDAGKVQRSSRGDTLVQQLEARTPLEVKALIAQATGAIGRGEVRAQTYPGQS